jgi:hypothetical protein
MGMSKNRIGRFIGAAVASSLIGVVGCTDDDADEIGDDIGEELDDLGDDLQDGADELEE